MAPTLRAWCSIEQVPCRPTRRRCGEPQALAELICRPCPLRWSARRRKTRSGSRRVHSTHYSDSSSKGLGAGYHPFHLPLLRALLSIFRLGRRLENCDNARDFSTAASVDRPGDGAGAAGVVVVTPARRWRLQAEIFHGGWWDRKRLHRRGVGCESKRACASVS